MVTFPVLAVGLKDAEEFLLHLYPLHSRPSHCRSDVRSKPYLHTSERAAFQEGSITQRAYELASKDLKASHSMFNVTSTYIGERRN